MSLGEGPLARIARQWRGSKRGHLAWAFRVERDIALGVCRATVIRE